MSDQNKMPSGIPFIIGNEAAERFSYYGMKAILVVFMTDYLKMSDVTATTWLHNFGAAVYAFPLIGALVADIFFGKYKTILSLSIVYCLGHLVLALFENQEGLLMGLTLIAIGSGGIKPCVSAHVGDQFNKSNQHLINRVFSIFYLSINLGAFISSLATPFLLEIYGPSIAFGVPGGLMLMATFVFWLGRTEFVHIPASGEKVLSDLNKKETWTAIGKLSIIYLFVSVFWSLFDQTGSTWVIQAKSDLMDKSFQVFGKEITLLPSQIQAANPLLILLLVPIFTFIIYPVLNKLFLLTPLKKVVIGMFIASISFYVVGFAEGKIYNGETVSVSWQLLAYFVLTCAEVMVSITVLEFSYTQAPNSIKSIIMSIYLLSVSLGNVITSIVNGWMIQEVEIENVMVNQSSTFTFQLEEEVQKGDKIAFSEGSDLKHVVKKDTIEFAGTYVIGDKLDSKTYSLLDIHRKPVHLLGSKSNIQKASIYTLNGDAYFNFFAFMMAITAVLFLLVAFTYKEKTYVQGSD